MKLARAEMSLTSDTHQTLKEDKLSGISGVSFSSQQYLVTRQSPFSPWTVGWFVTWLGSPPPAFPISPENPHLPPPPPHAPPPQTLASGDGGAGRPGCGRGAGGCVCVRARCYCGCCSSIRSTVCTHGALGIVQVSPLPATYSRSPLTPQR